MNETNKAVSIIKGVFPGARVVASRLRLNPIRTVGVWGTWNTNLIRALSRLVEEEYVSVRWHRRAKELPSEDLVIVQGQRLWPLVRTHLERADLLEWRDLLGYPVEVGPFPGTRSQVMLLLDSSATWKSHKLPRFRCVKCDAEVWRYDNNGVPWCKRHDIVDEFVRLVENGIFHPTDVPLQPHLFVIDDNELDPGPPCHDCWTRTLPRRWVYVDGLPRWYCPNCEQRVNNES